MRKNFADEELQTIASIPMILMGISFILSKIGGLVLYGFVSPYWIFLIDFVTYLLGAGFYALSYILNKNSYKLDEKHKKLKNLKLKDILVLKGSERQAFLILPFLALICAPATAILPGFISDAFGEDSLPGLPLINPVLLSVVGRTFGQIIGGISSTFIHLDRLAKSKVSLVILLLIFHCLYFTAFHSENLALALVLIVIAHIASNIIFVLGTYYLTKSFSVEKIGPISAYQNSFYTLAIFISAALGGIMASQFGYAYINLLGFLSLLAFLLIYKTD